MNEPLVNVGIINADSPDGHWARLNLPGESTIANDTPEGRAKEFRGLVEAEMARLHVDYDTAFTRVRSKHPELLKTAQGLPKPSAAVIKGRRTMLASAIAEQTVANGGDYDRAYYFLTLTRPELFSGMTRPACGVF